MFVVFKKMVVNLSKTHRFIKEEFQDANHFSIIFFDSITLNQGDIQNIKVIFQSLAERDLAFEKIIEYLKSNKRVCEI